MLKGDAVWSMTMMFLHMWNVVNGIQTPIDYAAHSPHAYHPEEFEGSGFVTALYRYSS